MQDIRYEATVQIKDVPPEWVSLFQLFDPYLPVFPLIYLHFIKGGKRFYGFPINFSTLNAGGRLDLHFKVQSNIPIGQDEALRKQVVSELEDRIGLGNKITFKTITSTCNGNTQLEQIVEHLWQAASKVYGKYLPYVILDKVYSIVRFIASVGSLSGKKSEQQMLYDFMSHFGERIHVGKPWNNFLFYLLPTYDEIYNRDLQCFPKFERLVSAMDKLGKLYFKKQLTIGSQKLSVVDKKALPIKLNASGVKWREFTWKLAKSKEITLEENEDLDFLVDAFNRMPSRAINFMAAVININKNNDYRKWTKNEIREIYETSETGLSKKATCCFLQQGFGNEEAVPIDTWIETFYTHVFNIHSNDEFLSRFSKIGKLERLLWLVSQGRKTNLEYFYDIVWCTKYGFGKGDKSQGRGPNPLTCYLCTLKPYCPGYKSIMNQIVYVDNTITGSNPPSTSSHPSCTFVVGTQFDIPKIVFRSDSNGWKKIDDFSGYIIHSQKSRKIGKYVAVNDFISDLTPYKY